MQWAGKQFTQIKRLFQQPKPGGAEDVQIPAAQVQVANDARSKERLRMEAIDLQRQLDALVSGFEATAVNGAWVQRFIDLHQQHMEIGCRLEDGTVNINAEVKRLPLGDRGGAAGRMSRPS
eukprot:Skav231697  [mRNA]  locus=scaffold597:1242815:1248803:- [translate_table: standard]